MPIYYTNDFDERLVATSDPLFRKGTLGYGGDGREIQAVNPGGETTSQTWDPRGKLTTLTDGAGHRSLSAYDGAGNQTILTNRNGNAWHFQYDAANRLTNSVSPLNRSTSVVFDHRGLPIMMRDPASQFTTCYYDAKGRLTNRVDDVGSIFYTYDPNDNLTNITQTIGSQQSTLSYTYDAHNVYDAADNRIGQVYGTNSITYVINPNSQIPQVLERTKNGVTTYYVYGPGLLYQVTETPTVTNTLTYHYDYRGSTIALTTDSGLVADRMEYSAYGTLTFRAGTDDTPFLFNGKYGVMSDPNGLLYMQSRYYNPFLCRFLNPDPSGFNGGLNFYAYANGNPITYLDPFGLGAINDKLLTPTWANAPTPEEKQVGEFLAAIVNLATLGTANIISAAITGTDLAGDQQLSVDDAMEQSLEVGTFEVSLLAALPTDGASLEADAILEGTGAGAGDIAGNATQLEFGFVNDDLSGRLSSFGNSGSPSAAEEAPILGGAYRDIEAGVGEVHHMPADSVSTLSRGDGPAIWMETTDHRLTASWGSSAEAQEYRAAQAELINQGKFDEALQMDINDIQSKFGSKYDVHIQQMLDYRNSIPAWKLQLQ